MLSKLALKIGLGVALATAGGIGAVAAVTSGDLPEQAAPQAGAAVDAAGSQGAEGQAGGEARREAAEAYAAAVRNWSACVSDAAAGQGDEATREQGAFDPRAGCGDRPDPADFGLTTPPEQASQGTEGSQNGGGAPETADQGRADSAPVPEETPPSYAPVPEDTPPPDPQPDQTPPAGQPTPESRPSGRP